MAAVSTQPAEPGSVRIGNEMKDLPNLLVLRSFRLNGEHVEVGSVIAKSDFHNSEGGEDKGTWSELVSMAPQTCTQTDAPVSRVPTARERNAEASTDRNAPAGKNRMPGA